MGYTQVVDNQLYCYVAYVVCLRVLVCDVYRSPSLQVHKYIYIYIDIAIYTFDVLHVSIVTANPTWGDIFESSKLERLFCHVSVKRDVRALSFELGNSIRKCHPKWDRLYVTQYITCCSVL